MRVLITLLVPLLSVHIDWSTSTLSPMLTGKLELLEIAEATANFRKSIEPYGPAEGTACQPQGEPAQKSQRCSPRDMKRAATR